MAWVVGAGLCLTAEAGAQPSTTRQGAARTHLQNGVEHYGAGRYAEAAAAFREAHAITHQPELLFNLGMSLERAGELGAALEAFNLFASAGAPGYDRAQLDMRREALRARIAAEAARSTAESAPTPTPALTPAPTPTAASVDPQPTLITQRIEVRYERSTLQTAGPWVLMGAGATVTLAGLLVGLGANQVAADVAGANRGEQSWSTDLDARYNSHEGVVGAAMGLTLLGAAVTAGGGLWLALRGPGRRREVALGPLGALVLPNGGGMLTVGGAL